MTNISWDHQTRELYEESKADGLEFHNHHNLLGEVLTTGQAVISNNPQDDSRAGGTPHGHPKLSSFLGLPILDDEKNLAIVKTIISTAKIFGLKTLAEGIETQEIAMLLAELGCDWGQGYYFDKPLSVDQFEKLLLSYKREY
ncbi:EAL domain-containing protein [Vibrio alginolyticus]|uniref:GAF domain-containing protein n=1 Tax=Vibrio TaxID=662 RepID=UPI001BD51363|nr:MULTISPECIES: EAL domain-containing protein [Vibrio]MBS9962797.1 EAL domain-containing protein [Vibrio alginolyticus]MDW1643037.1 EAL domain-containing protein [Vibrio sp. Vb2976]